MLPLLKTKFSILGLFIFFNCYSQEIEEKAEITISQYGGLSTNSSVNNIVVDKAGLIWVATETGLFLLNPSVGKADLKLSQPKVTDVAFTKSGTWVSASNVIYNLQSGQEVKMPNTGKINDLHDSRGIIWIGSDNGLYTYLPSTGKLKTYNARNSKLHSNKINFVHEDKNKIIWIGSDKGYIRIEADKWEDQDTDYRMLATHENHEGQWITSEDDLFLINKFNRLFPVGLDEKLHRGDVNDFTIDSKGNIYIASDFLVRYDPYDESIASYEEDAAFISSECSSIEIDQNDNIWIGTNGSGLYLIQFSDNFSTTLAANLVIEKSISCAGVSDGKIKLIVSGGIAPYSFKWDDNTASQDFLENLGTGEYAVIVTDASNKRFRSSITLPSPPPLQIATMTADQLSAYGINDGKINISASGGIGKLSYAWSNGESTNEIKNLAPGEYEVSISDNNGCEIIQRAEIKGIKLLPQLDIAKLAKGSILKLEQLYFDSDSTVVLERNFPVLNEVFDFLNENKNIVIEIGGHTNTIPSHEYCDKLSSSRAGNVALYLLKRGIDNLRITSVGYGKRKPLSDDRSLAGRKLNQRVEIKIIEI